MPAPVLSERPAWAALRAHRAAIGDVHLRKLFADDPRRGERLAADAAGLHLDYSKNRLTGETLRLLVALAEECGVRERAEAMFRGERINTTENRPVLHVALRAPRGERIVVDGKDVVPELHAVLARMSTFARRVREGTW
jgi:glucose-6-phosphate isomerase